MNPTFRILHHASMPAETSPMPLMDVHIEDIPSRTQALMDIEFLTRTIYQYSHAFFDGRNGHPWPDVPPRLDPLRGADEPMQRCAAATDARPWLCDVVSERLRAIAGWKRAERC